MKTALRRSQRVIAVLGSSTFFWTTVALLVIQAIWIALSGRYAMAFDEDFHLGIIRIYAHHLSPFLSGQPAGADAYGAVARDPSYLYHYLMSFPYRLISAFTSDQTLQVLWLRAINIALFAASLPLFRRLLRKTGASAALTNICLLLFVLVPVVPLLAAQINYDNLLLPVIALVLLLTLRLSDELRAYKRINIAVLSQLIILGLLSSLIKYAFLPIFVAVVIFVAIRFKQTFSKWGKFWLSLGFGMTLLTRSKQVLLGAALLLSVILFSQRYVVNLVDYHSPVPDCGQVLTVQQCSAYGPWNRDYNLALNKTNPTHSPLTFNADWLYGMWLRSVFAVAGPSAGFQTRGPLLLPAWTAIIVPGAALLAVIAYGRRVWRRYDRTVLALFGLTSITYLITLWLDEYRSFLHTGVAVAINGRYLFPVLPLLLVIGGLAFSEWLGSKPGRKLALTAVVVLGLAWGGGALTYIIRSNPAWYWPNTPMTRLNHDVQAIFKPIVPGSQNPSAFLSRN